MNRIKKNNIAQSLYSFTPVILLFISVLNEIDFNYSGLKYFSFNFAYILIFYYNLKKSEGLGFGLVFIAGLLNDVVIGMPIGLSSLIYLLLCGAASYLRNITLRPNLMKDCIFFLMTILTLNSLSFLILTFIFSYELNYLDQVINIIFTFTFYLIFSYFFNLLEKFIRERS
jgi:rod shape-determining protein MreD|tara:strand:+ start:277 stop:789 length:513 start_codon:yes stop_codon:yes gene_type:complete